MPFTRNHLRRFRRDRSGNFAILSAIAAIPLTLAVGMGTDMATIARAQSMLQQALDAAALGVAREGRGISDAAAFQIADEFVRSNFSGTYSNLKVTRAGTSFRIAADGLADTSFGGLFGYKKWPVSGKSTADIAYVPYEIALVLDTTGSMNEGGKLKAMKDAVTTLVDTMSKDVADKKKLKFAMVPFAAFVNVGPQYAPSFDKKGRVDKKTGASWLDIEGKSDVAQVELKKGVSRFEVFHNLGDKWAGCVETRQSTAKVAYDVTDAVPTKKAESLFVPALAIDEPDNKEPGGEDYGNSYIKSDVDPTDKSAKEAAKKLGKYGLGGDVAAVVGGVLTDPASVLWQPVEANITATKGPNAGCQVKPMVPLSSDYAGLKSQVQALAASGNTNITEGVAWGWRVLSPGEPFTQGAAKTSRTKKIVILLTDGSNTFGVRKNKLGSAYTSFGFAADERLMAMAGGTENTANEAMNEKTLAACTNAKADGLEIFTIRLEEPDKTTGMMLKDCASDADHFFDAPSSSQLDEVFSKIRQKIVSIRISS